MVYREGNEPSGRVLSRRSLVTARPAGIVFALAALYVAQGIPFGLATEYLPVVLRESGSSYGAIAALSWLQLPWQAKIFWAKAADHPRLRPHARVVILVMQLALTFTVAGFGIHPLREGRLLWYGLTFVAAFLAATQDVFVDAFAVRVLRPDERGFGNTAQVAGYRLGMLVGGATLLLLVGSLGERMTLLGCAGVVAIVSVGAFVGSHEDSHPAEDTVKKKEEASSVPMLMRHLVSKDAWIVLAIALTFKLGLHMAAPLLKPMAVDYGWTKTQIGGAVVTAGTASALIGAFAGGLLHRVLHEKRALIASAIFQAAVCAPLVIVDALHAPIGFTTAMIALEHFGSGLGTTVLFAALMTATRPADAGLHYTILTSANAMAIGLGGLVGGLCADAAGKRFTFVLATVVCLAPLVLLARWNDASQASRS